VCVCVCVCVYVCECMYVCMCVCVRLWGLAQANGLLGWWPLQQKAGGRSGAAKCLREG